MESYIDEAVKKIMNYHPIDGCLGAEKIGNFLVMPHGERLYSLWRADSDAVIIVKADMAGIRSRINEKDLPAPLRGAPIVMIAAALMSIAFMGFSGLQL